jgi:hypothetical protein
MFLTKKPKALTLPLWREAFTGIDWLALKASPVFYGLGIPRGDNSPVVLIPGFMGNDWYLLELYFWLKTHRLPAIHVAHRVERRVSEY